MYHWVCAAWPVRHGYLPSHHLASAKLYCLVTEAHMCEQLVRPGSLHESKMAISRESNCDVLIVVWRSSYYINHYVALSYYYCYHTSYWLKVTCVCLVVRLRRYLRAALRYWCSLTSRAAVNREWTSFAASVNYSIHIKSTTSWTAALCLGL